MSAMRSLLMVIPPDSDLLRPEVDRMFPFWQPLGAVSGAMLGFIFGNIPGAFAGGVAGGYAGKIRGWFVKILQELISWLTSIVLLDAKGKSVADVFLGLPSTQRATVLAHLAQKILGTALGSGPRT